MYDISQPMGVPAKLTERQIKFAELLVYNEGRKSPAECASESGYKSRPRQAASELRNPKYSPLVVKYIGELRAEVQGAWSAATNAEVARGKAAGLYVDQKLILSGNLDQLSEKELESRMKQILDDHKVLIDGVAIEATSEKNNLNKLPPT